MGRWGEMGGGLGSLLGFSGRCSPLGTATLAGTQCVDFYLFLPLLEGWPRMRNVNTAQCHNSGSGDNSHAPFPSLNCVAIAAAIAVWNSTAFIQCHTLAPCPTTTNRNRRWNNCRRSLALPSPVTDATTAAATLRGQRLCIADLGPAFASWKQGVNPLHARVRQAPSTSGWSGCWLGMMQGPWPR